jgi:aminopeptidase N
MLPTAFRNSYIPTTSYKYFLVYGLAMFFLTCNYSCKTASRRNQESLQKQIVDSVLSGYKEPIPTYHPTAKKTMNLVHTKLFIKPDWNKSEVIGKAEITLTPHFYDCDSLWLDAQSFQIKDIYFLGKKNPVKANYTYDQKKLHIKLNKTYTRKDTVTVVIEYFAKPLATEEDNSEAISSDKGLFFINPQLTNPYVPRQLWSQGETTYNSKWFPTIEANNQRMTQEIYLTVDKDMITLSNGLLLDTKLNPDGTKTDYWKQSLAATPYLTMIAAGNFSVVKDTWKGKEVSYYVEPGYERYAKLIFGKTPKMMSFFSERTGIDYPWEKYSQIAVRDYVSGAMENTTATVHAENIQRTERELLEENGEDVISHELFHHWFGDYVTCESWSNLPLNESFATYGEYLWLEHEYGIEKAESHRLGDLENYLSESKTKQVSLIRPYFVNEEEMFDSHSYAKGGLILHHLRKYLGDVAFFTTLNYYLKKHAFGNAEIEELRIAFEEISGEDLNWFFDQWFKMPGHPDLEITYQYVDSNKTVVVKIDQHQENTGTTLYKLPATLDLFFAEKKESHSIWISAKSNIYTFKTGKAPIFVMVDGEQNIPGTRLMHQEEKAWIDQYNYGKLFTARLEAISMLIPKHKESNVSEEAKKCLTKALSDTHSDIRYLALKGWEFLIEKNQSQVKNILLNLAQNDSKPHIRRTALELLNNYFKKEEWLWQINLTALEDRAYSVQASALSNLYELDPVLGFERAKRLESDSNLTLVNTIAEIYAQSGTEKESAFFEKNCKKKQGFDQYDLVNYYGKFLLARSEETIAKGVQILSEIAQKNSVWFIRLNAMNQLSSIEEMYAAREKELKAKSFPEKTSEETSLQKQIEKINAERERIKALMAFIKKGEKNQSLIKLYNN